MVARAIAVDSAVLAGKPVIEGTRIPVSLMPNLLGHGYDVERIVRAYPILTTEDVQVAIRDAQDRLDREEIRALARA